MYSELLVPMGIEDMVTGKIGFAPAHLTYLSIYRGRGAEAFNRREKSLYRILIHHASKAYALQERLLGLPERGTGDGGRRRVRTPSMRRTRKSRTLQQGGEPTAERGRSPSQSKRDASPREGTVGR